MGLVTQVDVEQGDVKVQFMFSHGPCKTSATNSRNSCLMDLKIALNLKLYFERSKREPSPNFGKMLD